jgi:hypothetical protein
LELAETQAKRLEIQVEESWDDQLGLYTYRDRETGLVQRSRLIAERIGRGTCRAIIQPTAAHDHRADQIG